MSSWLVWTNRILYGIGYHWERVYAARGSASGLSDFPISTRGSYVRVDTVG